MGIKENKAYILNEIQSACEKKNRSSKGVNLIAVTKYVSNETTREAVLAGIQHIGENRIEGLLSKKEYLKDLPVNWHFIGTLQTRKVKDVIEHVDYIHSLDRLSLANEIQKRADKTISCFVQVNVAEEDSKHGLPVKDVVAFVDKLKEYDRIKVVGLMTMAPFTEDESLIRNVFSTLKQLQLEIQKQKMVHAPCTELSMGMSNDYSIAVEEGATFIRVGTSLVGKEF
ncbi:YggS family pyridoxal phosphate-dependent enzyme [Fictibacillus phosphorivorans]|uniref:YggS family pyridoxal phosphate-dependent enzyme n=1 Tax=Fictibacillus phosphorivorans TaxID=1221500 RepID=UPI001292F666|nr:YggS family pyridoxal phosphate-dependent enzyme [Fictibacillus phosphorivorans]MQR96603.1 YggS family pyridoxal phosphate-dependent enzyme [Fictibacillus phosphorivorans]